MWLHSTIICFGNAKHQRSRFFNDRQFFTGPQEVKYKYDQLNVPMDPTIPDLNAMLKKIKDVLQKMVHYTFEKDGRRAYIQPHLMNFVIVSWPYQMMRTGGQTMILHVLKMASADVREWDTFVTQDDVENAMVIIEQKYSLMPSEIRVPSSAWYPYIPLLSRQGTCFWLLVLKEEVASAYTVIRH